jgi:O-antigen ligase
VGISREIVFWGICLLIAFIPLPYGGVGEGAIFIFEVGVFVLAGVHAAGTLRTGGRGEAARKVPWPVKALVAIFLGLSVLQIVPLPRGIVEVLSPRIVEIKGGGAWAALSLAPAQSLYELLKYAALAVFGYLVYVQARSKRKVRILVFVMMASGVFQALYGLGEYFGGSHRIFGWKNIYYPTAAFGTFVNRNHYSAFLEMMLALSIGYLLARADFFAMKPDLSLREKLVWFGQERLQKTIIAGIVPVILGVGIVFSWSRSGVFVFLASLLTMIVLASWAGKRGAESGGEGGGKARSRRLIRTVFAGVVGIALMLGISPLLERFSAEIVRSEGRPLLYKFTGDVIRAFPLSGVGLGCYMYGYNMFEARYTPGRATHAHNDYLEVLAESGLPGGAALVAAGLAALAVMAARWLRRRDNFVRGVGLGCVAGIAGILVHSFTDFSLRMPANAAYLVTLYALGLRVVGLREERELDGRADGSESRIGRGAGSMAGSRAGVGAEERASAGDAAREAARKVLRRARRTGVFKAAGLVAGLVALLFLVVKENMGFVWLGKYEAARARLAGEGRSLMSGFAELERLLGKAVRWSGNPRFFNEQGRLYIEMAIAENESEAPERRDAYLDRAEEAVRRRIERNPADAFAYYDMSRVYLLYNFPLLTYQDAARRYLRRALVFKPHDLFLNVEAVYKFSVMWDGLGGEEKAWMFGEMRSVWPVNEDRFYPGLVGRWQREVKDLDKLKEILRLDPLVWSRASQFFPK